MMLKSLKKMPFFAYNDILTLLSQLKYTRVIKTEQIIIQKPSLQVINAASLYPRHMTVIIVTVLIVIQQTFDLT